MTSLLSVEHLNKSFKDSTFKINNVSFEVHEGEMVALIGKNGSGKSTLIRMIVGDYPVDQGKIEFFGEAVSVHQTAYKMMSVWFLMHLISLKSSQLKQLTRYSINYIQIVVVQYLEFELIRQSIFIVVSLIVAAAGYFIGLNKFKKTNF